MIWSLTSAQISYYLEHVWFIIRIRKEGKGAWVQRAKLGHVLVLFFFLNLGSLTSRLTSGSSLSQLVLSKLGLHAYMEGHSPYNWRIDFVLDVVFIEVFL